MLAPVAASLPAGAEVVVPVDDFASVVFPFLVHRDRGVVVHQVPLAEVADQIRSSTTVVAFSLVQSADGRLADLDAILDAARRHGALTVCDTTQAVGWLPVAATSMDVTELLTLGGTRGSPSRSAARRPTRCAGSRRRGCRRRRAASVPGASGSTS